MCLIAFEWDPDGPVPLLLAANRDEFYDRPTAPMAWWEGGQILAGRDLRAGGTWLGMTRGGRFAAITNYRDPRLAKADMASRGQITRRFLEGTGLAAAFLGELQMEVAAYNPFNLLLFDGRTLVGYESRHGRALPFTPGIHAVSNGDFDEPWPKVEALTKCLAAHSGQDEALLSCLQDDHPFEEAQLPSTGVPLAWERALSPVFVRTPSYGTRASTLLRLGREAVALIEQRHSADGTEGRSEFVFQRR